MWENYITKSYDRPNRQENLEIERQEEVDAVEKGPYFLRSEVGKAIREMKGKKVTAYDDVPGDVLKLRGEDGLRIATRLINNIHATGEWTKDFTEVTTIAFKN
jgi:hypothetical protein